jgi:hypothetical protein
MFGEWGAIKRHQNASQHRSHCSSLRPYQFRGVGPRTGMNSALRLMRLGQTSRGTGEVPV